MRSVGVRALQQNAGKVLRQVGRGEVVEVPGRGHRVAFLVPASGRDPLQALETAGRLVRAEGDLLEIGEPLRARRAESASRRLAKLRASER